MNGFATTFQPGRQPTKTELSSADIWHFDKYLCCGIFRARKIAFSSMRHGTYHYHRHRGHYDEQPARLILAATAAFTFKQSSILYTENTTMPDKSGGGRSKNSNNGKLIESVSSDESCGRCSRDSSVGRAALSAKRGLFLWESACLTSLENEATKNLDGICWKLL